MAQRVSVTACVRLDERLVRFDERVALVLPAPEAAYVAIFRFGCEVA